MCTHFFSFFHLNQQVLAIVLCVRIQKLFLSQFILGLRATKGFFLRIGHLNLNSEYYVFLDVQPEVVDLKLKYVHQMLGL